MRTTLTWDEAKRKKNLAKHGLDFAMAGEVLESRFRLDIPDLRSSAGPGVIDFLCTGLSGRADRGAHPER